ncbi:phosphotransferase enzyme family protein [Streptomyces sp. NBC_01373]|uniref:phosphotransferase enzyme family protein n=1 Tax=Streptomyces sp. NBC_01373 TaxID=2903843 RepID=UPI00224D8A16|nr:phosphotransferase [Streptomyces sp. NBC_01373]MCX4706158.1 phosphotransferase [Streptomyces sp. NBC_01373]
MSEAWDSPVADQVAARWGYPAGTARWWRSSASHVFVLPDNGRRRYLRFVPGSYRGPKHLTTVAELMARLSDSGSAVVRPVAAECGALTMTVATGLGAMHSMVVEPAPGEEIDVSELTASQAWQWGQALARLHRDAAGLDAGLPESFGELPEIGELFADDTALVEATERLTAMMSDLPRCQDRWGVVHGDFELDNMAWEDGRPTAYDFDEAALSWYAADIAYAVRDLTDHTGRPATGHRARFDAFLDGYRSVRPIDDEEVRRLPLFAGLHAAASLVRITRALGEPAQHEPEWLSELRDDLTDMARTHRQLVIDIGRQAG